MSTIIETNWINSFPQCTQCAMIKNTKKIEYFTTLLKIQQLLSSGVRIKPPVFRLLFLSSLWPDASLSHCPHSSYPPALRSSKEVGGWNMAFFHSLLAQLSEDKMTRCQCTRKCFQTLSFFIGCKDSWTLLTDGRGEFSRGICPATSLPLGQQFPRYARQVEMLVERSR